MSGINLYVASTAPIATRVKLQKQTVFRLAAKAHTTNLENPDSHLYRITIQFEVWDAQHCFYCCSQNSATNMNWVVGACRFKNSDSTKTTYNEAFVPLFDLLFGEVRVLFQKLQILFGELRFGSLDSHGELVEKGLVDVEHLRGSRRFGGSPVQLVVV